MKSEKEALENHMNKGEDQSDPYWLLFKCKDAVNDSIVNAYSLGFKRGYAQAQKDMIKEIQKLKKQNEILKSAVEFYADKKNINFMDGCHIEKNEDGEEVADGGYRARQALKDAEEIK
jgi:hypothetical protein